MNPTEEIEFIFDTAALMKELDRRDFLCRNVPKCEACGHEQVQLIWPYYPPAQWRCRICSHDFAFEPNSNTKTASTVKL